jgi:hypothetical protein
LLIIDVAQANDRTKSHRHGNDRNVRLIIAQQQSQQQANRDRSALQRWPAEIARCSPWCDSIVPLERPLNSCSGCAILLTTTNNNRLSCRWRWSSPSTIDPHVRSSAPLVASYTASTVPTLGAFYRSSCPVCFNVANSAKPNDRAKDELRPQRQQQRSIRGNNKANWIDSSCNTAPWDSLSCHRSSSVQNNSNHNDRNSHSDRLQHDSLITIVRAKGELRQQRQRQRSIRGNDKANCVDSDSNRSAATTRWRNNSNSTSHSAVDRASDKVQQRSRRVTANQQQQATEQAIAATTVDRTTLSSPLLRVAASKVFLRRTHSHTHGNAARLVQVQWQSHTYVTRKQPNQRRCSVENPMVSMLESAETENSESSERYWKRVAAPQVI